MTYLTTEPQLPLTGFTIGVTAARRAEEFTALLERRGAAVMHAPAIRIIPLVDDAEDVGEPVRPGPDSPPVLAAL